MNELPKIRRVYLSVELADGRKESIEVSDPANVTVNVSVPETNNMDFSDAIARPYGVPVREPITLTMTVGRKGYTIRTDFARATEQQLLAQQGSAEGQCQHCGSYRLDGNPPLIHQFGCPEDQAIGMRDWWQTERTNDL